MTKLSAKRALQLMLMLGALTGFAHGQVLLEDNFSGSSSSTPLNGRTPDGAHPVGDTWIVTSDGSNTAGGGVETFSDMTNANFNYLAFSGSNFTAGNTYTLSTTFNFTSSNGWFAIGFTSGSGGAGNVFSNPVTVPSFYLNDGASGSTGFADGLNYAVGGVGLDSGVMEIQLAVDATGAGDLTFLIGADANSLTAINPGAPLTLSEAEVQGITGVGFTGQADPPPGKDGTLSSFELSAPEPSTYAMVAFGLGALVLGVRLRRLANRV